MQIGYQTTASLLQKEHANVENVAVVKDKRIMLDILTIKRKDNAHLTGSCLCAGVTYKIDGPARDVVNCFCSECRKTSGHHVAATRVNKDHLIITSKKTLKWYKCSSGAYKGFCTICGGNLFWDNNKDNQMSISAGTLDPPTHLQTIGNIHTEDASDYSKIPTLDTEKE